jgi:aminoglycoside phosphotransferase (APT) family kinase protein
VEELKAPDGLAEWMSKQGLGDGPLENISTITGGTQNIMLRFARSGRPYVLRRSNVVIMRETQVLAALAGTDVPHPRLIASCDDPGVLGDAVFYLMEPIDGFNAGQELPELHAADPAVRFEMGLSMADALAKLGAVDYAAAGLSDYGKPEGPTRSSKTTLAQTFPASTMWPRGSKKAVRRRGHRASCTATTTRPM